MKVNGFYSRLSKKKDTIVFLIIAVFFVYATKQINPEFSFTGDGLNKLIQAEGLLKSNFTSENLYYPAIDLDPDYNFFPFPHYQLDIPDRKLGQYPVAFSIITAMLLKIIAPEYFAWFGIVLALLVFFSLKHFFKPPNKFIVVGAFTTFILLLAIEFSENIYSIFLTFTGFSIFITELTKEDGRKYKLFLAGCLIGLGMWLRLEGIIFAAAMTLGYIITFRDKIESTWFKATIFLLGTGLFFLIFLIFNYADYGHILGPRYLIMADDYYQSVQTRLNQAMTLLFYNQFKVGYFVFTPYFLLILLLFSLKKHYLHLELKYRFIYFTLIIYIPLIAFLAPNDGVVTWGPRYLAYAVLPNLVLIKPYLDRLRNFKPLHKRIFDILNGLSILLSVLFLLLGTKFYSIASRQIKSFDNSFATEKSALIVFQGELLTAHVGLNYFKHKIVLIKNTTQLNNLIQIIKNTNSIDSIAFYKNGNLTKLENTLIREKCKVNKNCLFDEGYFTEEDSRQFDAMLNINFKETGKETTKLYTVARYKM